MSKKLSQNQCSIRFTFENNRLYVSMETLYSLNRPEYVQLLISADRKMLYIVGCTTKTPNSFRVPPRVYTDAEYVFVLRKAPFAEAICHAQKWDNHGRYRLYGAVVSGGVVGFCFDSAQRLDMGESEEKSS